MWWWAQQQQYCPPDTHCPTQNLLPVLGRPLVEPDTIIDPKPGGIILGKRENLEGKVLILSHKSACPVIFLAEMSNHDNHDAIRGLLEF